MVATLLGQAWARVSSYKALATEQRLDHIVLTFQYAENIENAPKGSGADSSRWGPY